MADFALLESSILISRKICMSDRKIMKFPHCEARTDYENLHSAVWKFYQFSITQILREINFRDSRNAKCAIF